MILDVSKENCIRAAAEGDCATVRRYFAQLERDTKSDTPDEAPGAKARLSPSLDLARTLFSAAIENDHTDVVQTLLTLPARDCIHSLDALLPELLAAAIDEDAVDIVKCLLDHGADANDESDDDFSPLCRAAMLGSLDIAQALVAHGAKVGTRHSATGRTALHEAAKQGDADVVAFLISGGADVDAQDYALRETPLMSAVKKGHRGVVHLLTASKAQLNTPNIFGSTALHIANVEGQREICQLLEAAGATVFEVPRTPRRAA